MSLYAAASVLHNKSRSRTASFRRRCGRLWRPCAENDFSKYRRNDGNVDGRKTEQNADDAERGAELGAGKVGGRHPGAGRGRKNGADAVRSGKERAAGGGSGKASHRGVALQRPAGGGAAAGERGGDDQRGPAGARRAGQSAGRGERHLHGGQKVRHGRQ